LLPVRYVHPVFTLPQQMRPLTLRNQKVVCAILFRAVSESIKEVNENSQHLGAEVGSSFPLTHKEKSLNFRPQKKEFLLSYVNNLYERFSEGD